MTAAAVAMALDPHEPEPGGDEDRAAHPVDAVLERPDEVSGRKINSPPVGQGDNETPRSVAILFRNIELLHRWHETCLITVDPGTEVQLEVG
jgi:hypothetical protein